MKIFLIVFLTITSFVSIYFNYAFYTELESLKVTKVSEYDLLYEKSDKCIKSQRRQKNEIADLWYDQASINDDLADNQKYLVDSAYNFIRWNESSIRFVDGKAQLFPSVNQADYLNSKNSLSKAIEELDKVREESGNRKNENNQRIIQIYLDAGEDRNNSANEREGFKETCLN